MPGPERGATSADPASQCGALVLQYRKRGTRPPPPEPPPPRSADPPPQRGAVAHMHETHRAAPRPRSTRGPVPNPPPEHGVRVRGAGQGPCPSRRHDRRGSQPRPAHRDDPRALDRDLGTIVGQGDDPRALVRDLRPIVGQGDDPRALDRDPRGIVGQATLPPCCSPSWPPAPPPRALLRRGPGPTSSLLRPSSRACRARSPTAWSWWAPESPG